MERQSVSVQTEEKIFAELRKESSSGQFPQTFQDVQKQQLKVKYMIDRVNEHITTRLVPKIFFKEQIYQIGDFIFVHSFPQGGQPSICKILAIYKANSDIEAVPALQLQQCLRKSDFTSLRGGNTFISANQLFPSNRISCQFATAIKSKAIVLTLQQYVELQSTNSSFFYTRAEFDAEKGLFNPPLKNWRRVCVCQKVPCVQTNGRKFLVCRICEEIFHRQCLKIASKTSSFICQTCQQKRMDIQFGGLNLDDWGSPSPNGQLYFSSQQP